MLKFTIFSPAGKVVIRQCTRLNGCKCYQYYKDKPRLSLDDVSYYNKCKGKRKRFLHRNNN